MLTVDYDILGIRDGERILDVGCGDGRHICEAVKRNGCTVYALDVDQLRLAKANYILRLLDEQGESRGRWVLLRGDAMKLPFKDACFDRVICSEVLEHLVDDGQGVRELVRVLKDDGRLAVSVPTYLSEAIYWKLSRDYHHQPGGHIRKYRANELATLLRQHGLSVHATRHKHALHSIYWLLRCLFGINREKAPIPSLYHRFLVWDIKTNTRPVRLLEGLLNRFMAKSVVFYSHKTPRRDNGA